MEKTELHNCKIRLRENPQRRKEKVCIGCGAGFGGDRPLAALKLLQRVQELDYLVLECLAERTLADRYHTMMSGGDGYDSHISEWMSLLLPLSVERGVCIVTNMGAIDPLGAQKEVLHVANNLGLDIVVSLAYEVTGNKSGSPIQCDGLNRMQGGVSTYLGSAPIVECLEKYKPNVVITSRVADAALFLAPMVYELGWNWNDFKQLAQGSLAGHLLECGCQLTGGYFMHPGDRFRNLSFQSLLDLSLPFAEVGFDGEVCVAKVNGSGGVLNYSTCAEQLLYEVGDPSAYITPDVVVDFQDVSFSSSSDDKVICVGAKPSVLPVPGKLLQLVPKYYGAKALGDLVRKYLCKKHCGWKGWGEISYGGYGCVMRAKAASFLVNSWMEEAYPGVKDRICSYIIGLDSLKVTDVDENISYTEHIMDVRLRMDGLFEIKEHAVHFVREFTALYTNGPAGGGGISTGNKREIILLKELVERELVGWRTESKESKISVPLGRNLASNDPMETQLTIRFAPEKAQSCVNYSTGSAQCAHPAPSGTTIPLYQAAHSRAGDKGNDLNFSIIPHFPRDIARLKAVVTPEWVKSVVSNLLPECTVAAENRQNWLEENVKVEIYEARGIHSLNVVVRNILDGGVNRSRRIDRHGKTVSDLILCQKVVLPASI